MAIVTYIKKAPCPIKEKEIVNWVKKAGKLEKKITGKVEVVVVGKKEIKDLNKHYRGQDSVTDVLSFAWNESKKFPKQTGLGQVVLCWEHLKKQASDWEVASKEEFVRMLFHGLLHLAGHDHVKKSAAKKMFALQEELVNKA